MTLSLGPTAKLSVNDIFDVVTGYGRNSETDSISGSSRCVHRIHHEEIPCPVRTVHEHCAHTGGHQVGHVLQSSFFEMNLANLPNLANRYTFYTKYLNLSSKCSEYILTKTFQNEIKF